MFSAREKSATATCPYCGVGCRVHTRSKANQMAETAGVDTGPNKGLLCQKGAFLPRVFDHYEGRALYPMIRPDRTKPLRRVSWAEAFGFIAERLQRIRTTHGPRSLAFYGSGQLDTEASYLFTKLFKGSLQSNHMDTNSRLCMSSAVAGYIKAFGQDAPPTCYDDIEEAESYVIVGANMAVNHPILFQRIQAEKQRHPDKKIICIDPRRCKTAQQSDHWVHIQPGGDVALFQLLAYLLVQKRAVDEDFLAHTSGWNAFLDQIQAVDPEELLEASGASWDDVQLLANTLARTDRFLSFYCQGTNQSTCGVDKNLGLINLHLMRGAVARVGAGPFSLTGQPNAMGGREVGYLAHQLPGYRLVANAEHRAELEQLWRLPSGAIHETPGYDAVTMFEALRRKELKAMWIVATNPVVSMPHAQRVREALIESEFLVVQDAYHPTETTRYADVVLPAAQWSEKDGTMTNSERLVARTRAVMAPPGEAMPDWQIVCGVARAMGFDGYAFDTIEQIWDEYRGTTRGRPCDHWGITNKRLAVEPMHWPCTDPSSDPIKRRYLDHVFGHPDGKAKFHTTTVQPPDETPDTEFPLTLTTGRIASQWHTRTRTGKVPDLASQEPEPYVEIHPDDAARFRLRDRQLVRIDSPRGYSVVRTRLTDVVPPGTVFAPFHWGDLFHKEATINNITNPAFDPVSKQPEFKACKVRVEGV